MFKDRSYKIAFTFAIVLHVALIIFLFIKFVAPHYATDLTNVNIINAVAVSQSAVKSAVVKASEKPPVAIPPKQQPTQEKIEPKPVPPKSTHVVDQKQAQLDEQIILQKQMQDELALKKKQQKLKQQEAKRLQEELAREAKEAQATAQKETQQQELNSAISAEKVEQQAAAKQNQGEVDKYKAMVLQAISSNWIVPDGVADNATCSLLVSVAPGGVVLDVKLLQSSGNQALDRSAQAAVLKSSPLPVPESPALFDNFRSIKLTVRPEGIR